MHQRKWLCTFGLASCFALIMAAQDAAPVKVTPQTPTASEPKPGEPVKVAAHFSKWDYPKEVTVPDTQSLYLVVKGDTLWDLGQKFLGNPFSWPQIWELNKWIKDPHWIYPGDPLIIDVQKQVIAKPGVAGVDIPKEIQYLKPDQRQWKRADELAYTFRDFVQMPFLVKNAEEYFKSVNAVRIMDRKYRDRNIFGDGEKIYLDTGSDNGAKVGDRLLIQKIVKTKLGPPNDEYGRKHLGDVVQNAGIVRLIAVEAKGSVAVVESSMDALEVGDHAVTFTEPANIPAKLRTDVKEPIPLKETATLIYASDHRYIGSVGEMIIVDKGSKDGFQVGDILLGVREQTFSVGKDKKHAKEKSATNYYLGQALVVKVGENNATCRVLRSVQELLVGDNFTR